MLRSPSRSSYVPAVFLVVMVIATVSTAWAGPKAQNVVIKLKYRNGAFDVTVGDNPAGSRVVIDKNQSAELEVQPVDLLLYKVTVNAQATTEHWPAVNPLPGAGSDTQTKPKDNAKAMYPPFETALWAAGNAALECNTIAGNLAKCITDCETAAQGKGDTLPDLQKNADTEVGKANADWVGRDLSADVGKGLLSAVDTAYSKLPSALPDADKATAKAEYELFQKQRDSMQASFDKAGRLYNAIRTASFAGPAQTCSRADGNRITFTITVEPNTELINHQFQGATYKVNVVVRNGIEVDSSAGFVLSRLVDHKYKVDGGKVERVKGAEDAVKPAGVALLHVYRDTDSSVKWGGSVGVATDDAKRIDYLAGLSMFFTNDRRLVVTAGIIAGPVSSVDRSNPIVKGAVNLTDRVNWAPFLGVTWNLSR